MPSPSVSEEWHRFDGFESCESQPGSAVKRASRNVSLRFESGPAHAISEGQAEWTRFDSGHAGQLSYRLTASYIRSTPHVRASMGIRSSAAWTEPTKSNFPERFIGVNPYDWTPTRAR